MLVAIIAADVDFKVYWNVPSIMCSKNYNINVTRLLSVNKILVNQGETFNGDKIVMFYESQLGKYPFIDPVNGDVNGGLPQLADLSEHIKIARRNITNFIPNPNFDGIGVIDWETWRPIWNFNWIQMKVYQERSIQLMKTEHPDWPSDRIQQVAKENWEKNAKKWMLRTLRIAQKLRPRARWCYYYFPDCYNHGVENHAFRNFCNSKVQKQNNRLTWLWNQTSAICPSVYMQKYHIDKYNATERTWWIYSRLVEALRLSRSHTPIYPYMNYIISGTNETVPKMDFKRILGQIGSFGLDGAIIWGSSFNMLSRKQCEEMYNYVKDVIAPTAATVISNVNRCSIQICNGRGYCVWKNGLFTKWKHIANRKITLFNHSNIFCHCQGYSGRYCQDEF